MLTTISLLLRTKSSMTFCIYYFNDIYYVSQVFSENTGEINEIVEKLIYIQTIYVFINHILVNCFNGSFGDGVSAFRRFSDEGTSEANSSKSVF